MWTYLFKDISHNGFAISVVIVSVIFSITALYLSSYQKDNSRKKLTLIYAHLFFFFFPLIFVSSMWSCEMPILECLEKKILWIIPLSILATFGVGFFILPHLYRKIHLSKQITNRHIMAFVRRHAEAIGLKRIPKIYFIDSAVPIAHSFTNFRPSIYISVGMFELLSKKEIEAIILHELHHIKTRSSFLKFSTQFARLVSPLARFTVCEQELREEELHADNFAVKLQKTNRYIISAKRKINKYG